MKKHFMGIIALFVCFSCIAQGQTQNSSQPNSQSASGVAIVSLSNPAMNNETFSWRFQIRNPSAQDIWICDAMDVVRYEAYLAQDGKTLLIRRRLDLSTNLMGALRGQYVRLRSGEARTEAMSFPLPILPRYVLREHRPYQPLEDATHVVLEIGYYVGEMPKMVLDILRQAEARTLSKSLDSPVDAQNIRNCFGGALHFLLINENSFYSDRLLSRSDWVEIPYTWGALKGEQVLQLEADGLHIPYLEEDRETPRPDLIQCTRIEAKFRMSGLGFFFPHLDEQNLLSTAEKQYLQSLDTIVIKDPELLKAFAKDVAEGLRDGFVAEHGIAELTCYRDNERLMSLAVYDCSYIVRTDGQVFRYTDRLPALRRLTPQIRSLDVRAQCATHLEDLWYRLRTHHARTKTYPIARRWCDDIVETLRAAKWRDDWIMPAFQCPSKAEGKCHYAMNPNCVYDSPSDVVLLFETKAGWNQHGGPELFTFDNHDPKGGLVLLNDGTVKFIRTEEELKQLRWK